MICERCKREMLEGYIPTPAVQWVPKYGNSKLFYSKKGRKEDGFRLGRWRQLSYKEQPAWYCPHCELIIIDCKVTVD